MILLDAAICVDNCESTKQFTSRKGTKCYCNKNCKEQENCCEDYQEDCNIDKKAGQMKGPKKSEKKKKDVMKEKGMSFLNYKKVFEDLF